LQPKMDMRWQLAVDVVFPTSVSLP